MSALPHRTAIDVQIGPDRVREAYEALPDAVKTRLTYTEYLWLPDAEKGRLLQRETEPDWDD